MAQLGDAGGPPNIALTLTSPYEVNLKNKQPYHHFVHIQILNQEVMNRSQ